MATLRDVATLAGVSVGTVSNVLNRPSYVQPAIRHRVNSAIRALDFVPKTVARQYPPGRGRVLGLALADIGNPFFVDVALGAEAAAKELGMGVVMVHSSEDPEREEQNLNLLLGQRVHGIMIAPVSEASPWLQALAHRGVPMVFVDRTSSIAGVQSVAVDDFEGGMLAGRHLAKCGHQRFAFVGPAIESRQVAERRRGFSDGLGGAAPLERILTTSWTYEQGRVAGAHLAARALMDRPTAIFCANDLLALGLLQELLAMGVKVPSEIAIVGFDDLSWASMASVPLSSVRQPREELGRIAVGMLLENIDNGATSEPPASRILYPELIVRRSSAVEYPVRR